MKTAICVKKWDFLKPSVDDRVNDVYVCDESELFKMTGTQEDHSTCESDDSLLQVIPYVTLVDRQTREIFVFKRGMFDVEPDLQGKCSIGLSGHLQMTPNSRVILLEIVAVEAARELEEQVGLLANPLLISNIMSKLKTGACGVLYSNRTKFDRAHIAVAFFLEIDRNELGTHEKGSITSGQFVSIRDLARADRTGMIDLENWSKMVLNMMVMSKKFNV